ncbi:MAG: TolC family protein [Rhodothermales bacterium]
MLRRYIYIALTAVLIAGTAGAQTSDPLTRQAPRQGPGQATTQATTQSSGQSTGRQITLTLDEALQIALVNNHVLRQTRLQVDNANAQVREAWGQVMPQVNVQSGYTRNLKSANPFAGSEAGGLFGSFGLIDWLAFNEEARIDDDPTTTPITVDEFFDRQREGLQEVGGSFGGGDNPFSVPNEFQNGLSITQTLFSGSAFAAIKGAQQLKDVNRRAADRQEQVIIHQVRQAYYQALLAQQQQAVLRQSVERTRQTLDETIQRVTQGTAPKFQRLTAEVELTNLQTDYVSVQNQADQALDNLKMQLGMPIDQPVRLRGRLETEDHGAFMNVSTADAVDLAFEHRPDLEQARLAIDLRRIDVTMTRSQYLPEISAVANFSYLGRVPDNRTSYTSVQGDPFSFREQSTPFFSNRYWNPAISAGIQLTWNIFNGFQTSSLVQQRIIALDQAEIEFDRTFQNVRLEVQNAYRDLESARRRILAQEQNVQNAEINYEYARARLAEGVASPLEERNASEQLDQSRLNYLQAVHDFLVARSSFETAVGLPLRSAEALNLTSR